MKLATPKNGGQVDPVSEMQAASALRARAHAPYWYDEMPPSGVPFFVVNNGNSPSGPTASIASPAYGANNQTVLCSYQCPSNFVAVVKGILTSFDGSGFIQGSGNIIWTLDVDQPLPAVAGTAGYSFDGYGNLLTTMGNYANGLWRLYPGLRFVDQEIVRLKIQTVAVVGVGAPNFVTGMMAGWIVPTYAAQL